MHPNNRCQNYNYFSFISDRDKGIIEAVKNIFPNNHHLHCVVHIKRNVLKHGIPASKCVSKICYTFNMQQEDQWLNELQVQSVPAYQQIMNIDCKTWRSTSWIIHTDLPPRFGIVTSNYAESTNSMFVRNLKKFTF